MDSGASPRGFPSSPVTKVTLCASVSWKLDTIAFVKKSPDSWVTQVSQARGAVNTEDVQAVPTDLPSSCTSSVMP